MPLEEPDEACPVRLEKMKAPLDNLGGFFAVKAVWGYAVLR
jgi:hypothetical protein